MTGSVDIVIVNWNAGPLLAACLRSLAAAEIGRVARVVVVDNGSVDGSAEVDVPGIPLDIVRTGQNLGFGRACNVGAARGQGDYVLLLNPDTEVTPYAIDRAAAYLDDTAHDRTAVVGIRLVDRQGRAQRHCARFPAWTTFVGHSLGLAHLLPRRFPPMLMTDFDHRTSRVVDHVMGAFYMIRRETFDRLGGFDEDYFVYLEDLDLSRRVYATGSDIFYLAEAEAYHRQGGTSEQVKAHRLFYSLSSVVTYAFKHFGRRQAIAVGAAAYVIEPLTRTGRALAHRSPEELFATLRAFAMLYAGTAALVRKLRRLGTSRG